MKLAGFSASLDILKQHKDIHKACVSALFYHLQTFTIATRKASWLEKGQLQHDSSMLQSHTLSSFIYVFFFFFFWENKSCHPGFHSYLRVGGVIHKNEKKN